MPNRTKKVTVKPGQRKKGNIPGGGKYDIKVDKPKKGK